MNYTVVDVDQRSPEWFAARRGRVTGSCADDMLATTSKGWSTSRRNLRVKLALERITGHSQEDSYLNGDMKRGIELEPVARRAYEALTGRLVTTTGFLAHNELMAGCSLDGHIGDMVGIVDFKCPRAGVHLEYLRDDKMPLEYERQLTHNLFVTGAKWAELASFCPQFPESLRLHIRRLNREKADLKGYESQLRAFLLEVDLEVQAIATMAGLNAVLGKAVA